jgi:hypothetical protein
MYSPSGATHPAGSRQPMCSSRGVGPAERELGHKVRSSTRRALQLRSPLQRLDPVGQAAPTRAWFGSARPPPSSATSTATRPARRRTQPHQRPTAAAALRHELADSPNRKATRSQPTFHGVEPPNLLGLAVAGRSVPVAEDRSAGGARDRTGPENAAAPSTTACLHHGGTEGGSRPVVKVNPTPPSCATVILGGRVTSVPFTAVPTGPERTTTDNAEAASTCAPDYLRRSRSCPIWLWEQGVASLAFMAYRPGVSSGLVAAA